MRSAWFTTVLIGSAAAQQITDAPDLRNAVIQAARGPRHDPEICSLAGRYLNLCVEEAGDDATDLLALVDCACCITGTAAAPLYSECSAYLSEEAPEFSVEYEAYGTLYSVCTVESCGGSQGGSSGASGTSTSESSSSYRAPFGVPSTTTVVSINSAATASAVPTRFTGSAEQSIDPACSTMAGFFESCVSKVPRFSDLAYGEQANCYCCGTSGGTTGWSNELDKAASECAVWAETGEPETIYTVAKTFAHFCGHFRDACGVTLTQQEATSTTTTEESPAAQATSSAPASTTSEKGGGVSLSSSWVANTVAFLFTLVI